ncbi:MAG: hypothetical protein JXR22_04910 [Prolixibacteraceae bacterium]|nr:hypothetical protein [Prolixibacteraceae bacterium]
MKNLQRIGGFLLLVLIFSSCVKDVSCYEEEISKGVVVMKKQFPVRVSENLILEIQEINDTRCPVGLICSSGGEVSIDFKANINGTYHQLNMSYDGIFEDGCTTIFEGHQIQVLEVNPHPFAGDVINADNYRIQIIVDVLKN